MAKDFTDIGVPGFAILELLVTTWYSQVYRAEDKDGQPAIIKVALVDEKELARKLLESDLNSETHEIDEEMVQRYIRSHQPYLERRIQHNQQALLNQVDHWLALRAARHPWLMELLPFPDQQEGKNKYCVTAQEITGRPWVLASIYYPGGTLYDVVAAPDYWGESVVASYPRPSLSVKQILQILYSIAIDLSEMHNRGRVHLDINPWNLVLRYRLKFNATVTPDLVVLIDYATTAIIGEEVKAVSHGWAEPRRSGDELLMADPKMDIYSFGTTLRFLLTGDMPNVIATEANLKYTDEKLAQLLGSPISASNLRFGRNSSRKRQKVIVDGLNRLLKECLAIDPVERPTAAEIANRIKTMQRCLVEDVPYPMTWIFHRASYAVAVLILAYILTLFVPPIWANVCQRANICEQVPPTRTDPSQTESGSALTAIEVPTGTNKAILLPTDSEPSRRGPSTTSLPAVISIRTPAFPAIDLSTAIPSPIASATVTPLPTATPLPSPTPTATRPSFPTVKAFISDNGCQNVSSWGTDSTLKFEVVPNFDNRVYGIRIYIWNTRYPDITRVYIEPTYVNVSGAEVTVTIDGQDAFDLLSTGAYATRKFNNQSDEGGWGVAFVAYNQESQLQYHDHCRFKFHHNIVGTTSQKADQEKVARKETYS